MGEEKGVQHKHETDDVAGGRACVTAAGRAQSPHFHQLDGHEGRSRLLWNGRTDGSCGILPRKGIALPG